MTLSNRKQIAVWQPYFMGGGAEAVALWTLEALAQQYDVTLYTLSLVDLEHLNQMYGTNLTQELITIRAALPKWLMDFGNFLIANNANLRLALVYWTVSIFKQESCQYDAVLSTFNMMDLGRPGIQYLHWVHVLERPFHTAKPLMKWLMQQVNFAIENISKSLPIANSYYTAGRVKESYNVDAQVVYPPVVTEIEQIPWERKETAFLCSGRIVQAKQPHRIIQIIEAVRRQGFDVKLHITAGGGGSYKRSYQKKVFALANKHADWVQIHHNLPYKDYLELLARCRYGIHYKPEPFGISVAEMVKAGMIPFVRSEGGQVEIVGGNNQEILFGSESDAIEKIIQVLGSADRQNHLLHQLAKQKACFSTERFMSEVRSVVDEYLNRDALESKESQKLS